MRQLPVQIQLWNAEEDCGALLALMSSMTNIRVSVASKGLDKSDWNTANLVIVTLHANDHANQIDHVLDLVSPIPVIVATRGHDLSIALDLMRQGAADVLALETLTVESLELSIIRTLSRIEVQRHLTVARTTFDAFLDACPDMMMVVNQHHRVIVSNIATRARPSVRSMAVKWVKQGPCHIETTVDQSILDVRVTRGTWEDQPVFLVVVRDITDERSLQEQRLEMERRVQATYRQGALGRLGSSLSHELNNALVPILEHEAAHGGAASEFGGAIQRIRTLADLLGSFGSNKAQDIQPADICALILSSTMVVRAAQGPVATICWNVPEVSYWATVAVHQFPSVLVALVENAVEAGAMRLKVGLEVDENMVQLVVEDDGPGMSTEVLSRAPEAFFSTRMRVDAHGLGLASTNAFAVSCGGFLKLGTSSDLGGARVVVGLRRATRPQTRASSSGPGPLPATLRILLAEDDGHVRRAVARMLKRDGHTVWEASDGITALARMEEHQLDLLVSDVMMQPMDGPDLVRTLRLQGVDLPVLFITGHASVELPDGDAISLLRKPFAEEQLRDKINELWHRSGRAPLSASFPPHGH